MDSEKRAKLAKIWKRCIRKDTCFTLHCTYF